MSKLSHNKAVARHRRNRSRNVHPHYTKAEMKQLMPNFQFAKVAKFKNEYTATIVDGSVEVFIKTDKNGQIYDCSRIGNVFSQIYGRSPLSVDWIGHMCNEYAL